jgi:hypothetical protein
VVVPQTLILKAARSPVKRSAACQTPRNEYKVRAKI